MVFHSLKNIGLTSKLMLAFFPLQKEWIHDKEKGIKKNVCTFCVDSKKNIELVLTFADREMAQIMNDDRFVPDCW